MGRKVGFTGRMAVFEGKTLIGEKPRSVPDRIRAALAESVKISSIRIQMSNCSRILSMDDIFA